MNVSFRINGERVALLGWSRAILLQLAHPLIAAGVAEHSTFRGGPASAAVRLRHTVRAMLSLTFGGVAAREQTLERIRAIHRRVHGRLPEAAGRFAAGTPYSADDPALLLWVHATLIESMVVAYDSLVAPLSTADRDRYCAEGAPIAVALGARQQDVPTTWTALRGYVDSMLASDVIAVSPQARALADAVLAPPLSWTIAPVTWTNRLVTVGLLPPRLRQEYGWTWTPAAARRLVRTLRIIGVARRCLPPVATRWSMSRPTPTERR